MLLGLAYCHAKSPLVLPEYKTDFFSFKFFNRASLQLRRVKWDAKVSPGDQGRKSMMTSSKDWKLCHLFQWKLQQWPHLCFPVLQLLNSATNK